MSAAAGTAAPADELGTRLRRTVIQDAPSSIPGRRIVQVLTTIPVGVAGASASADTTDHEGAHR